MIWAEFTYLVSVGKIAPSTPLYAVTVKNFNKVLGRYRGDVTSLFTYGLGMYEDGIPNVAFGSLLHMIEDSFSVSHVTRDVAFGSCSTTQGAPKPGRVLSFNAYNSQDGEKHGEKDARDGMLAELGDNSRANVVKVGRAIKAFRDGGADWSEVRDYLDKCVFEIADEDEYKPAGPDEAFRAR